MAYILIASTNMSYRRDLAGVLIAAGHHVATTSDPLLTLSALQLSQRDLIVLLDGHAPLHIPVVWEPAGSGADQTAFPPRLLEKLGNTRHAYVLLTTLLSSELPRALRALVSAGKAMLVQPNCSIATLLTTVEMAAERVGLGNRGASN